MVKLMPEVLPALVDVQTKFMYVATDTLAPEGVPVDSANLVRVSPPPQHEKETGYEFAAYFMTVIGTGPIVTSEVPVE